ncbi:MAG: tripartite tricarboxylate transporter permease [Alphaproteobacteria bacterium]|nr:tripartite tricarboxylate transporter permease [Alphaproteobacteria bacterium]
MEYMQFMLFAAGDALIIMSDPMRLMFLFGGVIIGLILGVIPGLGGLVGMALLLPFTFDMDKFAAFAFLLGMGSVTTTSDTIPAVLFGVPGTTGSAATILDGHPMARKGEAGRAFGAAYTASMMGGLFGALLLAVSIPILRPVMLYLGSPELLSFSVFGLSMVAVLSGSSPMRGVAAACVGLLIAMVGSDPQTGTLRWTLDSLYLWDGLPIVPVTIGLFALPELADMAIIRTSIATDSEDAEVDTRSGQWQGVRDTFTHWWLVIRVAWLGAALGAIPGLGAAIVDWVAYGHAARTEPGAAETFGKGDVRGVLASEGANNAKEGGALVPTIAFGVPGSASMAILLGAFLIHGLIPGPDMLTKHLDVTYSMVWSVAIANILGAGLCFAFSNQFAKIALVRYTVIMPLILAVVFIGAFQGSRQWGDIYALLTFGIIGWTMKRLQWPRPPVILGVVLGDIVERYMFISVERYGTEWLFPTSWENARWVVIFMMLLSIYGLIRPLLKEWKIAGGTVQIIKEFGVTPKIDVQTGFYVAAISLFTAMMMEAATWNHDAKIIPNIVGYFGLAIMTISMINHTFRIPGKHLDETARGKVIQSLHLDLTVRGPKMEPKELAIRAGTYLAWLLFFLVSSALVGILFTVFLFVVGYMKIEGKEPWKLTMICAFSLFAFTGILFDELLALPWPQAVIGDVYVIAKEAALNQWNVWFLE